MRKFFTTIGLVMYAVIAMPAPATATVAAPGCPLSGDHVIAMTETQLLGWNEEQNHLGPFPAEIPAGTYELTVASYDDHSAKPAQDHVQPAEIWYLAAHSAGAELARSVATPDLPAGQDLLISSIGQIDLTSDVDSLMAHHGHFDAYNPNSVVPLCVSFTEVNVSPATVAPTVTAPVVETNAAPVTLRAVTSHTAPEVVPVEVATAPESVIATSSRGIVADPVSVTPPVSGVMGIQAQLVELPVTGFHPAIAAAGLMALALGAGLLRVGGRAGTVR